MSTQGFFLGAGASYELGMPLVTELTEILKRDHVPKSVRRMSDPSRSDCWPRSATEELLCLLADPDLHYEAIIGTMEVQAQRIGPMRNGYDTIRQHLVDMVTRYLIHQHSVNANLMFDGMPHLTPISEFLKRNHPLNIFSLNHDVMIEEMCTHLNSPISAGFYRDNEQYKRYFPNSSFEFEFETLTQDQLKAGNLNFFKQGETGVNLYKLHGALDTYLFNDRKDLVRFYPQRCVTGAHSDLLVKLQNSRSRLENKTGLRSIGIMTLEDSEDYEHFFDFSLITGASKFRKQSEITLGLTIFFESFRTHIYNVQELICVGYSFGDLHINEIMTDWLCSSRDNCLTIVDPFITKTPGFLLHLKNQVNPINKTFMEFLTSDKDSIQAKRELFMHQQSRELIKRTTLANATSFQK